ncbi:MAG: hypothetical protein V7K71_11630 [Nostoc sp.]|uniref:hypothetical protein n=1 Tax=Nostoc sp. TaxID=1180 RepID=UPI002FF8CF9E
MRYYPCRAVALLRLYILLYSDLLTRDRSKFFTRRIILSTQGKRATEVCDAIALCKYWVAGDMAQKLKFCIVQMYDLLVLIRDIL